MGGEHLVHVKTVSIGASGDIFLEYHTAPHV